MVMAINVGYAAVSDRPLNAREFSYWWVGLERYNLVQTKEGREQLKQKVGARIAVRYDDNDTTPIDPLVGVDAVADVLPFTDASAMLRILDPDDPRAEFLRAGGRLDAQGNPVLSDAARGRASAVQPRAHTQILSAEHIRS
jgi:hypothetical protein